MLHATIPSVDSDVLFAFVGLGLLAGLTLFSVVFRRVRGELIAARSRGIPRAVVAHAPGARNPRWADDGGLRSRLAHSMPTVQAGIVATAATSILLMVLCFAACLVLAVLGR
jgi:hypothetical protein